MKQTIICALLLFLSNITANAQTTNCRNINFYNKYVKEGNKLVSEGNYVEALKYYTSAKSQCQDKAKAVDDLIQEMVNKIEKEKEELLEGRRKTLLAIFDKAIKKQISGWKGYNNYKEEERTKLLTQIDSLDLSQNALVSLPKEIIECSNLLHINLLGNKDVNWIELGDVFKDLYFLQSIYVSINDISDIPEEYRDIITGIEFVARLVFLGDISVDTPNLNYLDLSRCNLSTLYNPRSFNPFSLEGLNDLKYLNLSDGRLKELPKEISVLKNLEVLNLRNNDLSTLPQEVASLQKLRILNLQENQYLTKLDLSIFKNHPHSIEVVDKYNLDEDINKNYLKIIVPYIYSYNNQSFLKINNLKNLISVKLDIGNRYLVNTEQSNNLHTIQGFGYREYYADFKKLKKLDISAPQKLPPNISNLKQLQVLKLRRANVLKNLPKEIGELENLQELSVGGYYSRGIVPNILDNIPKEIRNLKNLKLLDLSYNSFKEFPEEITELQALTELKFEANGISNLTKKIGDLNNLRILNLENNGIKRIPKEVGNLKNLEILNLFLNSISKLPKEIGNLNNLQQLILAGNSLEDLPKEIGNLTSLKTLDLSANRNLRLANVFDSFQNYPRTIKIGRTNDKYNGLTIVLPDSKIKKQDIYSILKISNLQALSLSVDTLYGEFGELSNLKTLSFDGGFSELPKEIGDLKSLRELQVYGKIKSLPNEIGKLKNLRVLSLYGNQLNTLPEEIGNLLNLKTLDIRGNNLIKLPKTIGNLKKLRELDLTEYSNSYLLKSVFDAFANYEKPVYVVYPGSYNSNHFYTSYSYKESINSSGINLFISLPEQIPSNIFKIKNLKVLKIQFNNLDELSSGIGQLQNLKVLDISNSKLTTLPKEISQLTNLEILDINGGMNATTVIQGDFNIILKTW